MLFIHLFNAWHISSKTIILKICLQEGHVDMFAFSFMCFLTNGWAVEWVERNMIEGVVCIVDVLLCVLLAVMTACLLNTGEYRGSGCAGLGKSCRYVVESSKSARFWIFWKVHQQINFWFVLGVTGKSRSQEMSIFEIFEHLKTFEHFGKLPKTQRKVVFFWVETPECSFCKKIYRAQRKMNIRKCDTVKAITVSVTAVTVSRFKY